MASQSDDHISDIILGVHTCIITLLWFNKYPGSALACVSTCVQFSVIFRSIKIYKLLFLILLSSSFLYH